MRMSPIKTIEVNGVTVSYTTATTDKNGSYPELILTGYVPSVIAGDELIWIKYLY